MDLTLDLSAMLAASLRARAQCNAEFELLPDSSEGAHRILTIAPSGALLLYKEDSLGRLQAAVIGQAYPPDQVCFTQLAWPDTAETST